MVLLKNQLRVFMTVLLCFAGLALQAQAKFTVTKNSDFKVAGTSSLHDWQMTSSQASGNVEMGVDGNRITSISGLSLNLPVTSLKSDKSGMDKNAYKALNSTKHPDITFILTKVNQITPKLIKATGNLIIAGTSRPVNLDVNYTVSGSEVTFEGSSNITFTDFKVDPPTAVFGTIKTGNDLILSFNTTFAPVKTKNL
jgi:hypothetical protein